MTDPTRIADRYIAVWNEADIEKRREQLAAGWSAEATYVDPLMSGAGHAGIAEMIEAARAGFPGLSFALDGTPDGHGPFVRFSWALAPQGGARIARGSDVVRLDGDGRIVEVIGFIDEAPRAAA